MQAGAAMDRLREAKDVKQVPGENRRRWFSSSDLDLTVWTGDDGEVTGFELCYDRGKNERSLRWKRGAGFVHERVDDGEGRPGRHKATPVLVPNGALDVRRIHAAFLRECASLPEEVATYVRQALERHPEFGVRSIPQREAGDATP